MRVPLLVFAGALAAPSLGSAQSLGDRVAEVRDGAVVFHYAARPGVCGDGAHFARLGHSYFGSMNDGMRAERCEFGPVQVRITRRRGEVDRIESWVGTLRPHEGRDLGAVRATAASEYLMQLARTVDGSSSSKAILPAVLADSSVVWPALLDVARDAATRPRATREDAAFWLSRFAAASIVGKPNELLDTGDSDKSAGDDLRTHAVFVMSQLPRNEGVPALLDAAQTNAHVEVRTAALFWLSQSGDPRALDLFERLLRK